MDGQAVAMMVLAMLVIWGGLVLAILNLRGSVPEPDELHRDL